MKKADIVERVAEQNGWTRAESIELVDSVFMIIKDTLADGEILKVSGFGVFSVKEKNDRKGRNPQTGEDITINARKILKFRASAVLKKAVNNSCTLNS